MTHLSSSLPDRIEIGAVRIDDWFTEIIQTDGGTERRYSRRDESVRSYEIACPKMEQDDADYLALKALYAAAKGNLHSFNFTDWTDDVTVAVRFDTPLQISGIFSGVDHIDTFTLVEVKDPEAA